MGFRLRMQKDQRGLAHIAIILVVLAAAGIGGFAFWRVSSYKNNSDANGVSESDGSGNNSATLSDECVAATGDENICRLGAISDLSKYSSEVTVVMEGDGGSITSVVKYDGKGNSEVNSDLAQGITIGSKTYVYILDNWYDTGGDSSQVPSNPAQFEIATTAGITYENQGKEPCGDDTCFKYRLSGGILGDGVVVVTFGDEDFLPRHYETTGGLTGTMTMDIEYKPVTISAPEGALPISSLYPTL